MPYPKYKKAECGHWSTEEYLQTHKLCAKCENLKRYGSENRCLTDEEKERRRKIRLLKRLKCEKCGESLLADLRSIFSNTAERYVDGEISFEEAERVLKSVHFRHNHTDHDIRELKLFEKYRSIGYDWESAWKKAHNEIHENN
ncbi:MAG: hypothetical protein HY929_03920 [Euryarchaeota archaeon]|nr:hypothetical protein [Euryarchaeota archaeon]